MTDKEDKCEKHDLPLSLYCDENDCKKFICNKCLAQEGHGDHKIYGMAVLKDMAFNKIITSRAEKLKELIEKLQENVKQLKDYKNISESYKDDLDKINATVIGKSLLSQGGKNKIQLVEVCDEMNNSLKNYIDKINEVVTNAEKDLSSLNLNNIIKENKTVDENKLENTIESIGSAAMDEGKDLLEKINKDDFGEQLENFKNGFSEPSPTAGKRKKPEKTEEPEPKEEKKGKKKKAEKQEKEEAGKQDEEKLEKKKSPKKKSKEKVKEEKEEKEEKGEKPKKTRTPKKKQKE